MLSIPPFNLSTSSFSFPVSFSLVLARHLSKWAFQVRKEATLAKHGRQGSLEIYITLVAPFWLPEKNEFKPSSSSLSSSGEHTCVVCTPPLNGCSELCVCVVAREKKANENPSSLHVRLWTHREKPRSHDEQAGEISFERPPRAMLLQSSDTARTSSFEIQRFIEGKSLLFFFLSCFGHSGNSIIGSGVVRESSYQTVMP